jgi:hypothetical protein
MLWQTVIAVKKASRSLGGRRISVQTAEKSVSFVDTSSANSYGYGRWRYHQTLLDFRRFALETFCRPDS